MIYVNLSIMVKFIRVSEGNPLGVESFYPYSSLVLIF